MSRLRPSKIAMVISDHTALRASGIPQLLPSQDRALSWACSVCVHTLALAVAAVATMSFRELPQAADPVYRLEIRLSGTQNAPTQATATDQSAQTDLTTLQDTAPLTEGSSPTVPTSSPSIAQRTAQRVTTETPPSQTTDRSSEANDQLPVESFEPIKHVSELSASAGKPTPPAPLNPSEAVEQAAITTTPSFLSESLAENLVDLATASSQPGTSSSPPTDPAPMVDSQAGFSDSLTAETADTVALSRPAATQPVSARSQYEWLTDLLRQRVMSLQSYPNQARTQGWEGTVVVKTTIDKDGSLIDAVVTKSSGYEALDQDAVRLMHRVCPVRLPQDLGKPKIAVVIPIRYRLDKLGL